MSNNYLQTDPRWADKVVGFGGRYDTFKRVGCTVAALTHIINRVYGSDLTPLQVNERLKAQNAFVGALVYWYRVSYAFPKLKWVNRDYNYNNAVVWSWIHVWPRVPVMVEVYEPASPTRKHWVAFIGNRMMFNPLRGIRPTSDYRIFTGSARYKLG